MEIEEMKSFFEEYNAIPFDEKQEALRFICGLALVTNNYSVIEDLVRPENDFGTAYEKVVSAVKENGGNIFDTEATLKKLYGYKDTLEKSHIFYRYKKIAGELASPFDALSTIKGGAGKDDTMFPMLVLAMMFSGQYESRDTLPAEQ